MLSGSTLSNWICTRFSKICMKKRYFTFYFTVQKCLYIKPATPLNGKYRHDITHNQTILFSGSVHNPDHLRVQRPNSQSLTGGGWSRLWHWVVVPARQPMQLGGPPVWQPDAIADFVTQSGIKTMAGDFLKDRDLTFGIRSRFEIRYLPSLKKMAFSEKS